MPTMPFHAVILLLACCLTALAGASPATDSIFVWLTDLHTDPFYGTASATNPTKNCSNLQIASDMPYGQIGCDSPWKLVESVLRDAAFYNWSDFVVVAGDYVRHNADRMPAANSTQAMADIILNITATLNSSMGSHVSRLHSPAVEAHHEAVVATMGNNDVLPNYNMPLQPNNYVLKILADAWSMELTPEEYDTVLYGGYLARQVTPTLLLISINTLIYSRDHVPASTTAADPLNQFQWLAAQLSQLQKSGTGHAYIVGHIPPVVDSFSLKQLWLDQYLEPYFSILNQYSSVVKAQLFAHLHADEFRVVNGKSLKCSVPLYIASSVSPIYDNNPAYRLMQYSAATGDIVDWQVLYMNLTSQDGTWDVLYTWSDTFPGVPPGDSQALLQLAHTLACDNATFAKFYNYNKVAVLQVRLANFDVLIELPHYFLS